MTKITNPSFFDLFVNQVMSNPLEIAIISPGEKISYETLYYKAMIISNFLSSQGISNANIWIVFNKEDPSLFISILWIIWSENTYVPIDKNYPKDRIGYILKDSEVVCLLTTTSLLEECSWYTVDLNIKLFDVCSVYWFAKEISWVNSPKLAHITYIMYTSWSTWIPKGILMNNSCLDNLINWQVGVQDTSKGHITLQFSSISFDVSFQEIFSTLCSWWTLVLVSENTKRNPYLLMDTIVQNNVTHLFLPFVALQQIASIFPTLPIGCNLREIMVAWEQLIITNQIRNLFLNLGTCILWNHYGPTETHVVCAYKLDNTPNEWENIAPIWEKLNNYLELYIVDDEGDIVSEGSSWELLIGWLISDWYKWKKELNNDKYINNPFWRWKLYRTGDLVKQNGNGQIMYIWRNDSQVKIRWYRIELSWIESLILQIENVNQCVVITIMSSFWTNEIIAYIVSDSTKDKKDIEWSIRKEMNRLLPDYSQPVNYVFIDSIPLTPTWKIDRKTLSELYINTIKYTDNQLMWIGKLNLSVTQLLKNIFLKYIPDRMISEDDNFFEMGINSLSIVKIHSDLQILFNKSFPIVLLFQYPTISKLKFAINDWYKESESKDINNKTSSLTAKEKRILARKNITSLDNK